VQGVRHLARTSTRPLRRPAVQDPLRVQHEHALAAAKPRRAELLRRQSGDYRDVTMGSSTLPEGIVTRFRTLSLERIGRVESVWNALLQGVQDEEAMRAMSHDLHTLKGDAKLVGFEEVHVLANKLEELLALARQLDY